MHLWSYDFQQISVFVGVSCMRCAHSALAFFFSWRVVLNENMLGVYFKRIWIRCFFWLVERERETKFFFEVVSMLTSSNFIGFLFQFLLEHPC